MGVQSSRYGDCCIVSAVIYSAEARPWRFLKMLMSQQKKFQYRAVSHPIQYSRQSRNIRRVLAMIAASWMVSLLVASPMVFGVNVRPPDANSHECRFYNAEFSIGSSIISFVIPCILVLFVYIRILITLKRREKAAKLRRMKKFQIGARKNLELSLL
ncbi:hypothetical protein DICVIV_06927 [Dictyocaulus viviparus]|uniref:G-protein coupled receptors family 1 profile domain-containing protein n=1 Tax=Dictyocaulus viviparus TaxID=29172 RepID=A0A0D8XT50_DICVI|nr:hypothetical protein DICVIV_06927 [Dictyocaulus viviparus]